MLFICSLCTLRILVIWKSSIVIPVPKKSHPSELNHYRPVSLTSIIMKCFEKLVPNIILPYVSPFLDSFQFAYKQKRGTDDAVACLLHWLLQHLDTPGNYARLLFIDFCSAFNSIQRHQLIKKLQGLQVPSPLIHWIYHFLSNRSQVVNVDNSLSPTVVLNTGAPQGCVLSPFLYILYTNDCQSPFTNIHYFKYADDTAILALLKNSDSNSFLDYQRSITYFGTWCDMVYILTFQRLKNCLLALLKHRFIQILILMERWLRECSILDTLELHWMIISVLISIFLVCIKPVNRDLQFSVTLSSCLFSLISFFSCIRVLLSQSLCMVPFVFFICLQWLIGTNF